MKFEMMPKEVKEYLRKDPPDNPDLPFWGLVCMASSAVLYALQINFVVLAILLPLIILLSLKIKWRFRIDVHFEILIAVVFFVILFISGRLFTTLQNYSILRVADYLFYVMALVLFVLMVIKAFKMKSRYEYYVAYLYSLLMIFICTFSVRNIDIQNVILFSVYAVSSNFYFMEILPVSYKKAETRPGKSIFRNPYLIICIPALIIMSFMFGAFMKKHEASILRKLLEQGDMMGSASFSDRCELGTLENLPQPRTVAMRIKTKSNPVRVTGKIYNKYRSGTWEVESESHQLGQVSQSVSNKYSSFVSIANNTFFSPLGEKTLSGNIDTGSVQLYTISLKKNRNVYFPDNAGFFASGNQEYKADNLGNINGVSSDVERYELLPLCVNNSIVYFGGAPPTDKELEIPDNMKKIVTEMTINITKDKKTRAEKVFAILQYLQQNHQYHKGISLERKTDPVLEFLTSNKAAHCEYFASGMALMLRSIGIPSRYAAGYVVHEYKKLGDYFVVRGKDAHAWVLVWVPEKGWLAVDPTPPSGIPSGNEPENDDLIEYLSAKIETMMLYIKNGEWKQLASEARDFFLSILKMPAFQITAALIIFLFLYLKYRRHIPRLIRLFFGKMKKNKLELSEGDQIVQLMLKFDALLIKNNLSRPLNLTLTEFSSYLREKAPSAAIADSCSNFVSYYAFLRYSGTVVEPSMIEELNSLFSDAEKNIRQKHEDRK
ncbi:MAG: DUF3488 and transglutaminase-like domain-containing protein [Firmicutes bacterium]|nr:DUF3488 and transglutaminase-like domain-containing protein [Bacillota bacterium]